MKYFLLSLCISALTICKSSGQTIHEIDVNIPEPKFYSNLLKLGGNNSKGDKISVNNYFLSFNDKPFIPITGEFHFSRYANQYWDESIKKIKAGGINVIATYVFWNIHEEKENGFNWKADNDLRRFVELCAKNNMYVIVRVGPFCHGEIRNGGLPDWIMGKALEIRSNDPGYLFYVERLFKNIGEQLKGLYFKDGGPIIGVKIQNSLNTKIEVTQAGWLVKCSGESAEFVVRAGGVKTRVLVINRSLALRSYVVNLKNKKYVFFSDAVVLQDNDSFTLLSDDKNNYQLSVYPQLNTTPKISVGLITKIADNKIMTNFSISQPEFRFPVKTEMVGQKKLVVDLPVSIPEGLNDIYLVIDYTGDTGMGFLNGELFADDFYKGIPWQIGLRKFLATQSTPQFVFYFRPMYKNATYLVDLQPYPSSIPDFGRQETFLKINKTGFVPEYKTIIQF